MTYVEFGEAVTKIVRRIDGLLKEARSLKDKELAIVNLILHTKRMFGQVEAHVVDQQIDTA